MSVLLPPAAETRMCVERSGKKKEKKKPCGRRGDCKLGVKNHSAATKGCLVGLITGRLSPPSALYLNVPRSISPISNLAIILSESQTFAESFSSDTLGVNAAACSMQQTLTGVPRIYAPELRHPNHTVGAQILSLSPH